MYNLDSLFHQQPWGEDFSDQQGVLDVPPASGPSVWVFDWMCRPDSSSEAELVFAARWSIFNGFAVINKIIRPHGEVPDLLWQVNGFCPEACWCGDWVRGELWGSSAVQVHHDHGGWHNVDDNYYICYFRDLPALSLILMEPLCSDWSQMVHRRRQDPTLQLGSSTGGSTKEICFYHHVWNHHTHQLLCYMSVVMFIYQPCQALNSW